MIKNYFSVIVQNIIRNKTYTLINILGLAIGLAVCMVIMQYVRFEESYDRFHSHVDDKYRIILQFTGANGTLKFDAANYAPLADALKTEFPEVLEVTRLTPEYSKVVLAADDKNIEVGKVYYADSTWFEFFNFKLLDGDPRTALADVNTIVLSESVAEKYFGPRTSWKESPLGKLVVMNNTHTFKVTGIMEDTPVNSHLKFNALISFTTFIAFNDPWKRWDWNDFYTYMRLSPGTDYKKLEAKLPSILTKYKGKDHESKMIVQPLSAIHLHSNVGFELNPNGNAQTVYILSVIAIVVLIIAWVNYVNLATARAGFRAREIGVRKVNGATRIEVTMQFMLEAFTMNFIALILSLGIVLAIMPFVGEALHKPLTMSLLNDTTLVIAIAIMFIIGTVATGAYPALVLSSFKPSRIFRPAVTFGSGKSWLRQGLVVFQFMISVGLITGTLMIGNQMKYIQQKDLGFQSDNAIVLSASSTQPNDSIDLLRYQTFRSAILQYSAFRDASISSVVPGKSANDLDTHGGLRLEGDPESVSHSIISFRVDENFANVFGLKFIAGKNFSPRYVKGEEDVIVNRKGAELFGFSDPEKIIGKKLNYWGKKKEVVGVVENYHHKSLKNEFEPMIMRHQHNGMLYVTVKLSSTDESLPEAISKLEKTWNAVYPNDPFVYSFLDDHVREQYGADQQFSGIFNVFSAFSIFIACLGLFGLVSYSVTVRMKEIGVRKVLGASIANIMVLFSKGYMKLLIMSFILGIPLAYKLIEMWLDNFAYRAEPAWFMFIIPALAVTVLSLIAVSFEIVKAAMVNPVKSLKGE